MIIQKLNHPYPLLTSKFFKWLLCFGGSILVLLFFWIFEPFGMFKFSQEQTPVILAYSLIAFLVWVIHLFGIQRLFTFEWTIGKTIFWLAWINFMVGFTITLFNSYVYNYEPLRLEHFLIVQWVTWTVGILPIILIVFIHENYLLRKNSTRADLLNEKNLKKRGDLSFPTIELITIPAENPANNFSVPKNEILYLTAEDNYLAVHYEYNGVVKQKLVRNSLKRVEKELKDHRDFLRCHKSYIVNRSKISKVSGNAAGYRFHLANSDTVIPVSRSLNRKLSSILGS